MPAHKGAIPWNKGLTKETDERVRKIAKNISKAMNKPETKRKLSKIAKEKFGNKNPNWQPNWDKLTISQKHNRMIKIILKPEKCSICNEKRKLAITNLDHEYSQNIRAWIWKCYSCHKKYDILEKL